MPSSGVPILAVLWFLACPPGPQQTADEILRETERLRMAGDLQAAVRLLERRVAEHPEDGDALRVLAQTLYWLGQADRARASYERGLVRHPTDTRLRLDFSRMLVETGDAARARILLESLLDHPAADAEARALLGTLAYWEGDLTAAKQLFTAALEANPAQADARRQLREIQALTASWMRFGPAMLHDDQPLARWSLAFEAGWFATPLLPIRVRVEPSRYATGRSTATFWTIETGMTHFAPALRLETELAAGVIRRPRGWDSALEWTGRGVAGIRLPRHVTVRARIERAAYLHTTASLGTHLMTVTLAGQVRWEDPRGWLGEAAFQRHSYRDGNFRRTRYGWLLAPVARGRTATVQAGYAFAADHADESRFVLAAPEQPLPPGDAGFRTEGRYDPYYTPMNLLTHSAVAALTLTAAGGTTVRLGGSYAIRATEEAPAFVVSGTDVQRVFFAREFSPWTARGSLEVAARDNLTVGIAGEVGRTAFYSRGTGGVQITYRFGPEPSR